MKIFDIAKAGMQALTTDKPNVKPIMNELASIGGMLDVTRGYVNPLLPLIPQDDVLSTKGGGNYDLYKGILSDPQVMSTFQQRRTALLKTEFEVIPGGKRSVDRNAADFLQEQIDNVGFDIICSGMHYGVFYGFAVAECMWGNDGRYVVIDDIKVRDRSRFLFDGAMRLRLRTGDSMNGIVLPDRKFWSWQTGADHDDEPYGMGLAHWLYWIVLFKRQITKFGLISLEKFASPTAVGYFPPSMSGNSQESKADRDRLLSALRAIQLDAGVILPDTVKAELMQGQRSGYSDYAGFIQVMDDAIAKVCIGQTMTSSATAGQYKADIQQDVLQDIVACDSDLLCTSFNRGPVKWLTEWNFPNAIQPRVWRRMEEPEDLNLKADRESKIFTIGYRPTLAQVIENYGGEWEPVQQTQPNPQQSSVAGAQDSTGGAGDNSQQSQDASQNQDDTTAGFSESLADPTPVTDYGARLSDDASEPWSLIIDQVKGIVDKAISDGRSLGDLRDDIINAYGNIDASELRKVFQVAFACADLAGRFEARQ